MHERCEIIMPPSEDVAKDVARILEPFKEGTEGGCPGFWDFFIIGGRWAGHKMLESLDQEKLSEFQKWLSEEKLTVSSLRAGKPELNPPGQIAKVDAKWNDFFPDDMPNPCPLFNHFNNQHGDGLNGTIAGDVKPLSECGGTSCSRVIVATPTRIPETGALQGPPSASYMVQTEFWNGVSLLSTKWDGTLSHALEMAHEHCGFGTPSDDWLVVTVDCHS